MFLPICHVLVIDTEVEVQDNCPKCDASFHDEASLVCTEYRGQSRSVYIQSDGVVDWDSTEIPEGNEDFVTLDWSCANCGYTVEGRKVRETDIYVALDAFTQGLTVGTRSAADNPSMLNPRG